MPLHCIIIVTPPLVLSSCWLVVACCVASVAGIFAACPSFGWLLCSPPSLASSRRCHQKDSFNTNVDVQRLATTGIRTLEQQKQGQCRQADGRTTRRERAAEGATIARVDKKSTQQEQTAEQKLLWGNVGYIALLLQHTNWFLGGNPPYLSILVPTYMGLVTKLKRCFSGNI